MHSSRSTCGSVVPRLVRAASVSAAALVLASFTTLAPHSVSGATYVAGEVLVKLQQPGDLPSIAQTFALDSVPLDQFGTRPICRLRILNGASAPDTVSALTRDRRVVYADENLVGNAPESQGFAWAQGFS